MSWTPTEKDVYGQEFDPSFADSMAKYHPESVYFEFDPIAFKKAWAPFQSKPKPESMKPMQILRGALVVTIAGACACLYRSLFIEGYLEYNCVHF